MDETNKPDTPAPSSDSQPSDSQPGEEKSATPPPNDTPPPSSATGPKNSPVDVEMFAMNPEKSSTHHAELGTSDSHTTNRDDSGAKKGR